MIDDVAGVTLASASTLDKKFQKELKLNKPLLSVNSLQNVQTLKVFQKWCSTAVDIYITDSVKALADAARENGLKF